MPVIYHRGSCLELPWSWGTGHLCVEPREALVIPWAHGSLDRELLFPGGCLCWRTPPGCCLMGSHGLVHASLDRVGSGMLGLIWLYWTVGLLHYIYSH